MNDIINGVFESLAGLFVLMHCRQLYIDKQIRGVSWIATVFFGSWGFWNLYYYPSLNQTFSFAGGILVGLANLTWLSMMWHYRKA